MRDRAMWVVGLVAAAAVLAPVAFWLFGRDDDVPTYGPSMHPTLKGSGPLDVDYEAYERRRPAIGDIVVLQGPEDPETDVCAEPTRAGSPCAEPAGSYGGEYLVKRIVAGPGDTIAIARDGRVIREGRRLPEPYVRRCRPADRCGLPRPATIPPGHYYVMGDNRPVSSDSRYWGPVPLSSIDGRVRLGN